MNIFLITKDGIKSEVLNEESYFIIDAKEFLQTVFEEIIKDNTSFGIELEKLTESAITLLKNQYIARNNGSDLITMFSSINKQDILGNESLLKAREDSLTLKEVLQRTALSDENKRIVALAYFNDGNLESLLDKQMSQKEIEKIQKLSLVFKKKTTQFFKTLNKNLSKLNDNLVVAQTNKDGKLYDSTFDEIVKNISTKTIVQKAYKSCQSLITTKSKKGLFSNSENKSANSLSFEEK